MDKTHLAKEEEWALAKRWQEHEDKAALDRLIGAHVGLVVHIARGFRTAGPPLEDLVQQGTVGLLIAARRFDPEKFETRLSTFATYWIRAFILEYVIHSHGPVRIGTTKGQRKIFFGLGRARRQLEAAGVPVDEDTIASALSVGKEEVREMLPRLSNLDFSLNETFSSSALDRANEKTKADLVPDGGPSPEDLVSGFDASFKRKKGIGKALKTLDERERKIIYARYLSEEPKTLEEIGKNFGVSRERVRQLETRAMGKLRAVLAF